MEYSVLFSNDVRSWWSFWVRHTDIDGASTTNIFTTIFKTYSYVAYLFLGTVKKSAENKTSAFGTAFSGFEGSKSDNPNSEEEQEKARHASWRTIKLTLIAFGSSLGILGGYLFFTLGM